MAGRNERYRAPAPPREMAAHDGVLLVDKPAGPTSHDIVAKVRRHFGFKKVGHGGTLDPQATGLLVLLIGRGTKLSGSFLGADKTYEGTLRLGITTDSHDAAGQVVREADWQGVTPEALAETMREFTGDIFQTPPMVSAIKVDGVPLYKRARRGETVERKPRLVHIYEFTLLSTDLPCASFRVRCTKGTYVRSLCADVGERLGCGAHLAQLRRTVSGEFRLEEALPLDEVLSMTPEGVTAHIRPIKQFGIR